MTTFYGVHHRSLQDQFVSREIADVLAAVIVRQTSTTRPRPSSSHDRSSSSAPSTPTAIRRWLTREVLQGSCA